jgi:hypothetical protein
MTETAKRLAPTYRTYREIFLKCGNVCAFPDCDALMMDKEGNFLGQICHIEAAEPGGARFNPVMTNEERRATSNLMLLCYQHHVITDNTQRFSVAVLKEMKAAHEQRFAKPTRSLEERLAKFKWQSLIVAGVLSGIAIDELAHEVRTFLDFSVHHPDHAKPVSLRHLLKQRLRYATAGVIYFYSNDPAHVLVGEQLLEILRSAGWRVVRLQKPPPWANERLDLDHSMLMAFEVADGHQLENCQQAIEEFFFVMCGFSPTEKGGEVVRSDGQTIRIYIPFLVHHRFHVPYVPRPSEEDQQPP